MIQLSKQSELISRSEIIKSTAKEFGFLSCGISKADFLEKDASILEKWLLEKNHGEMHYLANHFDKRLDPRLLVPGAKSVISLAYNYFPSQKQIDNTYKISKYAYGKDYHKVIKKILKKMLLVLEERIGKIGGRIFVDSAPILEKSWAGKSGLGWIGKNTNLIQKKTGSFFFLSEMILDIELYPDHPVVDFCGSCTACIDACPTQALTPYKLDASKCISYLNIELKNEIPNIFKGKMDNWLVGCDICQDVCPWNRFSQSHQEPKFNPKDNFLSLTKPEWEEISKDTYLHLLEGSAIKRIDFDRLKRNMKFLSILELK